MSSDPAPSAPKGDTFDVVVVGGGPAGATAALALARKGRRVALINRPGHIKPCGGAIPPRLIRDFDIPDSQIVARASTARMVSPRGRRVDMPIEGGTVGMVDREHFDAWLRARAGAAGARLIDGTFQTLTRDSEGSADVEAWIQLGSVSATLGDDRRVRQAAQRLPSRGVSSSVRPTLPSPTRR